MAPSLHSYSQRGVVTPDHIIRTKNRPLVVPPPEAGKLDDFAGAVREAVAKFVADYEFYFARENARVGGTKSKLDGSPRVVLVPGVGLFGLGRTRQGCLDRRRSRREHGQGGHRCRGHRPLRAAARERSVRARILEPRTGQAERRRGQAADRAGRRSSPAPARSAPPPPRRSPPTAPLSPFSTSTARRPKKAAAAVKGLGLAAT